MKKKDLSKLFRWSSMWFVALFIGALFEPSFQFKMLSAMIALLGIFNCYALSKLFEDEVKP